MIKKLILVFVLFYSAHGFAADIYVGADGSGTDDGTCGDIGDPCATVEYAVETRASNSDVIILRDGTHTSPNEVSVRVNSLTIRSHTGESAKIVTPCTWTENTEQIPYVSIYAHFDYSGLTLQNIEIEGGSRYSVSVANSGSAAHTNATIDNCVLHGSGLDVIKVQPKSDGFTLKDSEIYESCQGAAQDESKWVDFNSGGTTTIQNGDSLLGQTSGMCVDLTAAPDLDSGSWAGGDAAGTLEFDWGNWEESDWSDAGENWDLVNNCTAQTVQTSNVLTSTEAIRERSRNCQGIDLVQTDNVTIQDNHFHDIPYRNDAIVPKGGSQNYTIQRNKIDTAFGGILLGGNTGWDFMDYVENPTGYQVLNMTVQNNIILNTKWSGIMVVQCDGCYIYFNSLINVGTLEDNDSLMQIDLYTPPSQGYQGTGLSIKHFSNYDSGSNAKMPPSTDVIFKNNLIIHDNNDDGTEEQYYNTVMYLLDILDNVAAWHNPVEDGQFFADYNRYYDPNFGDLTVREEDEGASNNYTTISSWRGSAYLGSGAAEANSTFGAPLIDYSSGVPQSASPLKGAGVAIGGITTDYLGNNRGDPPTIGAVENIPATIVGVEIQ